MSNPSELTIINFDLYFSVINLISFDSASYKRASVMYAVNVELQLQAFSR